MHTVYPIPSLIRRLSQPLLQAGAVQIARHWAPYSRLLLIGEPTQWAVSREMLELEGIANKLEIRVIHPRWLERSQQQAVFFGSHFDLLGRKWPKQSHRLATAYFHGKPGTPYMPEFDEAYQMLCAKHPLIGRIQVTHSEMHNIILDSGIAPSKVFRIPIGINLSYFTKQSPATRMSIRQQHGLPQSAVIVGSFQKDGVGWGEGREPKLIKGPDIFIKTIKILKSRIPELFVLLSGPARGYVKAGLEEIGVPYRHYHLSDLAAIGQLFHVLDLYIVASRQEGGPKAVLEAMATGIPLITTRAGQAMDLVQHGRNGWMVDVEDVEGLAHWAEHVITHRSVIDVVLAYARQTAEQHSYTNQLPLWRSFMQGFVKMENE